MSGYKVSFNQDSSCITMLTHTGFRLLGINDQEKIEEIDSNDEQPLLLAERLFNTALVVAVTREKPNCLQMIHYKRKQNICSCAYQSDVLCIRMNRCRVVACLIDAIYIHDIRNMRLLHTIDHLPSNELGLCALSQSSHLAFPVEANTGMLRIYNAKHKRTELTLRAHDSALSAMAFTISGTLLATASARGTVIRVFCVENGQRVQEFRRGMKRCVRIASLVFSPEAEEFLCASSNTETVHIFKIVAKAVEEAKLKPKIRSPDDAMRPQSLNTAVTSDSQLPVSAATQSESNNSTGNAEEAKADTVAPASNANSTTTTTTTTTTAITTATTTTTDSGSGAAGVGGWGNFISKTVSSYLLPTHVSDVLAQDRAFAIAQLPQRGLKHVCGLTRVNKELKLLVAGDDGFLYVYGINEEEGGPCIQQGLHDLRSPLDGVEELKIPDMTLLKLACASNNGPAAAAAAAVAAAISTNVSCGVAASGGSYAGIVRGSQADETLTDIVALIANTTGIPHIQFDWKLETRVQQNQHQLNHQMSVSVAPSLRVLARAYWDIVKMNYDWKMFTIIYETEEGLARLQDLMEIQTINLNFIKIRKISDYEKDYRVLWKEVKDTLHEQRVILDCEPSSLVTLLEPAIHFDVLGPFKNLFLTHLDTHSSRLTDIYNPTFRANITSVRMKMIDRNPYERKKTKITKIDLIWGNQTMLPVLIYDAVILFANSARNLILRYQFQEPANRCQFGDTLDSEPPWYLGKYIVQEMKTISEDDVEPNFKTENMHLDQFGERTQFNLEIYKPTIHESLAIWKPDGKIAPPESISEKGGDAKAVDFSQEKKKYWVAIHLEEPYFMYKKDHENFRGMDKYEGYAVDLIRRLAEKLEFEYDFTITNGNGKFDPKTKKWDGIMRKLIDHQAHIGICDLTITQLRRQWVDFTVPFMQLGISILYYKKKPEPKNIFAFMKPFGKDVWVYILLVQLVMTLCMVFLARISHREWLPPNPADEDPDELENIWGTHNSFWLMIGSIMQQGCDILPRGGPMRILTSMWWFFALMILSTYTANLAAFLTSDKMQSTIDSLEALVDQDEVKYGSLSGGSTSMFFSESNETLYQKAWNQMKSFVPTAFTATNKEGVARVLKEKGNYAFLMETTSMSYNIEKNCDLKEIGSTIGEKHYGLAVPLGADYRSNLSVTLLQLSESGYLQTIKTKWWKRSNVTCEVIKVDGDELSIIELGGVFLVLSGGVLVAIGIGILEFLWNIQRVAAEKKLTPGQAFKAELLFVLKFWVNRKPQRISGSSTTKSSETSTSRRSSHRTRSRSRGSPKESAR